ncbi:MAG: MerR family transcriptional regulator [Ramlibacter sp.]|uniref:MerR family transcriptional regulator n=1 Tax=Ramlibacter sp. TaxID=1917967 RepID=UPI00260A47B6|nr:MerR family transcriptional regulator [Ramlibacter sp.]MDH4375409.1 MerR family transcriptional regulator [Ramlibacter sp.]
MDPMLPSIPAKRYFTIGEVSELCGVKPHVLRYWEQEFTQLRPMKRRGNRRYYQHHEVLMIRRIRDLLYDQGFTITGARNKLQEIVQTERDQRRLGDVQPQEAEPLRQEGAPVPTSPLPEIQLSHEAIQVGAESATSDDAWSRRIHQVRRELFEIRDLLSATLDRSEVARDSRAII